MLLLLPVTLGFWPGAFLLPFFGYFFHAVIETTEGGEHMDDDIYVFELFQQIMKLFDDDIPDSRMRLLSKDPRYAADDSAAPKTKTEKR